MNLQIECVICKEHILHPHEPSSSLFLVDIEEEEHLFHEKEA